MHQYRINLDRSAAISPLTPAPEILLILTWPDVTSLTEADSIGRSNRAAVVRKRPDWTSRGAVLGHGRVQAD